MSTRTYYRGPDAVVTSDVFVWRTAPPKTFVIRDLRKVGISHSDARHRSPGAQTATGSAGLVIAIWPIVDTPAVFAAVVLAVAIPGVVVAARLRLRPRIWELHATYRHTEVLLYASADTRVFNQVTRALRRAMEDCRPGSGGDLAA
jgi:hypothetical protein